MTHKQAYIIVGLALSVAFVCTIATALIWLQFSAPIPSTPTPILSMGTPTELPPTEVLSPTPTRSPTLTATRVVQDTELKTATPTPIRILPTSTPRPCKRRISNGVTYIEVNCTPTPTN